MNFSEFAQKLSPAIRSGTSTIEFARTLFESILNEEGQYLLDEYSDSSFKGFYNGNVQITRLAKRINTFVEPMLFEEYINGFPDSVVSNLCSQFKKDLPDIDLHNAGEKLAGLFVGIILDAAGGADQEKVVQPSGIKIEKSNRPGFTIWTEINKEVQSDPFQIYLDKAVEYYSMKKTLLYAESPRPFYSMYVCNDLKYHSFVTLKNSHLEIIKQNADVIALEWYKNYNIIQGTGGIGKSMFMTHLFLSSAKDYGEYGRIPVLCLLKNYKTDYPDLVSFIHKEILDFAPEITRDELVQKLADRKIILLLDGLDEVKSQLKESFDDNLESFIKGYPGNSVFMSSRPIASFVSYSKFEVYDLEPLSQEQAVELIRKLEFWDEESKKNFIEDLTNGLYDSHRQFASNPLLLTIMLMTYSIHGDIPSKMHVFYAKAYETMARLHDATKGSYRRPLCTGMTPEEFAVYFSQFCARTLVQEQLEFTKDSFSEHMAKVIRSIAGANSPLRPSDFLLDATNNLCIMYREGEKYFFIHRSFQEYFAACYFIHDEEELQKAGVFFEQQDSFFGCRMVEMMYDMDADKVERFIFLPYLEGLFNHENAVADHEYQNFLVRLYPLIYYNEGEVDDPEVTVPDSLVYSLVVKHKNLAQYKSLDDYSWPRGVFHYEGIEWVWKKVMTPSKNRNKDDVSDDDYKLVRLNSLSRDEYLAGDYEHAGCTYEVDVAETFDEPRLYHAMIDVLMNEDFPLHIEYRSVKEYYKDLKARVEKKRNAKSLFDD